jgi:hypothetical protein
MSDVKAIHTYTSLPTHPVVRLLFRVLSCTCSSLLSQKSRQIPPNNLKVSGLA